MVRRIYVEKKKGFDIEAQGMLSDFAENLQIKGIRRVRVINRYDMQGISNDVYDLAKYTVFAEPAVDIAYDEEAPIPNESKYFVIEYLPGQYDQRADSAAQCIQIMSVGEPITVKSAKLIILEGDITAEEFEKIKKYCINPVDSRESSLSKDITLEMKKEYPADVAVLEGFTAMDGKQLLQYRKDMGLAMSEDDILFVKNHFKDTERRNPTLTELKVLDTYWSDHCRHTTFATNVADIDFGSGPFIKPIREMCKSYIKIRSTVYGKKIKDINLMDIAVIGMKYLKQIGKLSDLDESEEINACSIKVNAKINGKNEDWLVMYKNETHNHPTEIEPFGGAATCLGGAVRDPLSGRSYVYQAMRVTGSGDPRTRVEETLQGKLPQRKITREAAAGYSSYGNQIGIATGQVTEIYHEGYVAKRMEVGAVIAAAPSRNVVRKPPEEGDYIILLGGKTGRDGCGGATGSSKEHTLESINTCSAEVQKGNPPTERNIQRLFRRIEVSRIIKRCNDFGAGGVAVAVGELADSLEVDLDMVPKKYDGLDGTELAISESQERMAVVVARKDADLFVKCAEEENLEAVVVARVSNTGRFVMKWRGQVILNLSRDFLNSNGVKQETFVYMDAPPEEKNYFKRTRYEGLDVKEKWLAMASNLNHASQKGLIERFDSTIGAGTVLMPLGGKKQRTPAEGMAALLPVESGECSTATIMSYGFNPELSSWSPFHGALYAVVESVAKAAAMGADATKLRLSFQEYFEKLGTDKKKWGKPFAALLGGLRAQIELEIPAIGGKDSMSGTFMDLNVPPSLISFAVGTAEAPVIHSPEFKQADHDVVLLKVPRDAEEIIDFSVFNKNLKLVRTLCENGAALAVKSIGSGGIAEALTQMCIGNEIGVLVRDVKESELFEPNYGGFLIEVKKAQSLIQTMDKHFFRVIGTTTKNPVIQIMEQEISLQELLQTLEQPLEGIFPTKAPSQGALSKCAYAVRNSHRPSMLMVKPKVYIPVFPGTNCEGDSARAFERAGAEPVVHIFRNRTPKDISDSIFEMSERIKESQIVMIPGGFSGGDEPDGSAKFITAVFRNERIKEAVSDLMGNRDGLMLGVCNGFQALIKLGLVPYGEIREIGENDPTLTFNTIGRHVSKLVNTTVASIKSPWLANVKLGDVHTIPVSHGEGRFIGDVQMIADLMKNGQIATRYVDESGMPTMDIDFNPNGSFEAIEGITSPDGRIFGKMGHSERIGKNLYKNVYGEMDQKIFESGVAYFKS